jgi:hypothetical protein
MNEALALKLLRQIMGWNEETAVEDLCVEFAHLGWARRCQQISVKPLGKRASAAEFVEAPGATSLLD